MSEILYINSCVRPVSRTKELADHLMNRLNGNVSRLDLYDLPLKPLDMDGLNKRNICSEKNDYSLPEFDYAKQFASADIIVIAAPFWDLLFPAVLRTYLEAVSVAGLTFKYSEEGRPIGLCKGKKLYYVTTAGGFLGNNNFGYEYVKALSLGLFGIKDVECISAEGLDVFVDKTEAILNEAKKKIDELDI